MSHDFMVTTKQFIIFPSDRNNHLEASELIHVQAITVPSSCKNLIHDDSTNDLELMWLMFQSLCFRFSFLASLDSFSEP